MVCRFDKSVYIRGKSWALAISAVLFIAMIIAFVSVDSILIFAFGIMLCLVPPLRIWHHVIGKKYNTVTLYNDAVVIDEGNDDFMVPKRIRVTVFGIDRLYIGKDKIEIRGNLQAVIYRDDVSTGQPTQLQSYTFMREYENDGAICERLAAMERIM